MQRRALVTSPALMLVAGATLPLRAQEAAKSFKPEELDQMLAPIALYPDQRFRSWRGLGTGGHDAAVKTVERGRVP